MTVSATKLNQLILISMMVIMHLIAMSHSYPGLPESFGREWLEWLHGKKKEESLLSKQECIYPIDCPEDETCRDFKCIDPCSNLNCTQTIPSYVLPPNGICIVRDRKPKCVFCTA
ncbi:hypothetical protein LSTR_LSTR010877 [Laodelphax striatellus]|uniref:Uncharacterized protein n=1 Tax=Laodelphax striatellus TaxID=195883 RepID=A0A482XDR4_LAOST|nr:hypothetical protein LSTR_LSTR010877 [Laodelphax striatellus]